MALPQSQATGFNDIRIATLACISSFEDCLSVKPLMKEGWAENRLADMKIWASRVGALAKPEVSLDHRLQFEAKPRLAICNILLTLETFIKSCHKHAMNGANGDRLDVMPRYEDTSASSTDSCIIVDPEPTLSSESWFMALGREIGMDLDHSDTGDESADNDYEVELKRSMDDVDDLLGQLDRLSSAILKSGTAARLLEADESFNPELDVGLRTYFQSVLIRSAVPRRQNSDVHKGIASQDGMQELDALGDVAAEQNHLIIANLQRRHRFDYAKRHQPILSAGQLPQFYKTTTQDHVSQGLIDPKLTQTGPALSTAIPEVPEARRTSETIASTVENNILNFAIPSEPATTVMSVSAQTIECPSLPPTLEVPGGFKCPCCYMTLPDMLRDEARWTNHLMEDLCPYTCPFPDCERENVLYISRTSWLGHILESHGKGEYWKCQVCSGTDNENTFSTATDFACHNRFRHRNAMSEDTVADLQVSCRKVEPPNIMQCPLCPWPQGEEVAPDAMASLEHVGSCIYEFSLKALPWST